MTPPIRIGLVGYGYWGPNIARNLMSLAGFTLVVIADSDAERRALAEAQNPGVRVVERFESSLHPELDAVAVATPVATHRPIACAALEAGLHVFSEKPLADSVAAAEEIVSAAESADRRLMVGHTFVYTGAVRKLRDLVESGQLGDPLYFDSCRVNLGLVQQDVDVVWDLAVHDLSILDYLIDEQPSHVSATGVAHAPSPHRSTAFLTLFYPSGFIAHIDVNWRSPVKIRRTLLGGTRTMAVWDDVEPSEKIKVYDSGLDEVIGDEERRSRLVQYRVGDMTSPRISTAEALAQQLEAFGDWIADADERPPNDGRSGLRVVRVLDAASRSMDRLGAPVEIAHA